MAEKWKDRAEGLGAQLTEGRRDLFRSPALVRGAEGAIRFLLGAVLASGELFGGYAPFGVGLVACSGSGVDGLLALLGAAFGYLLFQGFPAGLRYAAACVLVFSVAFAFYDVRVYAKRWFMPLVAAGMDLATGIVYLSDAAWRPAQVAFFSTEVLLAGVSAYLYRLALSTWQGRGEDRALTVGQKGGLFFLVGSLLLSLAGVTFLDGISLGRILVVLLVLSIAKAGGQSRGAAAGVALGLGMDLAAGGSPFYTMAYGAAGLLSGAGWKQGRVFGAITFVVANAVAVAWTWETFPRMTALYETFMASVLFLLLPEKELRRLSALLGPAGEGKAAQRAQVYVGERLTATAQAFRQVRDSLRGAFPDHGPNDGDPASIFDRTAERVCRKCVLRNNCWEHDYVSTYNALNDALPAMLERGKGEANDFPAWFASRCMHFSAFLGAANEELTALRYRRQYQARLKESRGAVCRQYETLAQVLSTAATELSAELTLDPIREKKLRQHLAALDLEGETAVYYDQAGHLRAQVTGEGAPVLTDPAEVEALSALLGLPLRAEREGRDRVLLLQAEPLMAVAGAAARRREGQGESGDTGTWFKREDGSLFVLLCDGMGSGQAAHKESALAVRLLEEFLRAGLEAPAALRTVNSALALKNEETGAFTTVDLLRLDLYTGQGEVCKLGAAPTYLKRRGTVSRLVGTALPAGLTGAGGPDVTPLDLAAGDWVLLISDGVADPEEDGWLRDLLTNFRGDSPKDLARLVMEESEKRVGAADDRTAVAIELRKR